MAINDVATESRPTVWITVTQNGFWSPGTPATSFRWFHLHSLCGAILFGSHQRHLPYFIWHSLVGFCLLTSVCNAWQRSRTQNLHRVLKNSGLILTCLWSEVHLSMSRFAYRRHSPLSLEIVEKPEKCKSFWPQFFWRNDPDFSTAGC